jgi:hypothetical protein
VVECLLCNRETLSSNKQTKELERDFVEGEAKQCGYSYRLVKIFFQILT